jgi:hypothetical protein
MLPLNQNQGASDTMGKITTVTGSSTLANIFFGIAAYYSMGSYYGWNQAQPLPPPSAASGASAMSSGAHPAIVIAILLACALVSSVPAWVIAYRSEKTAQPKSQPDGKDPRLIAIQSPNGGAVPMFKIVRGFAYPSSPALVQVLVQAGAPNNMRWFLQPEVDVTRYEWKVRCKFGAVNSLSGWVFRVCAVMPKTRITEGEIKNLPEDAIASEIITVSLDRNLSDETI